MTPGPRNSDGEPWTRREVQFARVPLIGPRNPFARLGEMQEAPLLELERAPASASPYQRPHLLAETLGNVSPTMAEAIRAEAPFVIAGQQPGIMLGPAFTLLKAATAVSLARRLAEQCSRPVVPAFWIASEDHDIEEVNRCTCGEQKLVLPHASLNQAGPRPPVGSISLEPWRPRIIQFAEESLRGLEHGEWVLSLLQNADYTSYATFFGSLLTAAMGGHSPVLIDPMTLRSLTAPVIAEVVRRWDELEDAFARATANLQQRGFTPPLDRLSLFEITAEGRTLITDPRKIMPQQVLDQPERFSPGAALRPIVQDAVIPTIATVAGPTELLYLWQIDPLYDVLGVKRSAIAPRLGATFVDAATMRRAEKFGLSDDAILDVLTALEAHDHAADPADADLKDLHDLGGEITRRIEQLTNDQNAKSLSKARESIEYQVGRVIERVRQQRLEQIGVGRRNLQRIADIVYPGGQLQERSASAIEMLARHGPAWIDQILQLDPLVRRHHLIETPAVITPSTSPQSPAVSPQGAAT